MTSASPNDGFSAATTCSPGAWVVCPAGKEQPPASVDPAAVLPDAAEEAVVADVRPQVPVLVAGAVAVPEVAAAVHAQPQAPELTAAAAVAPGVVAEAQVGVC